MASFEGFVVLAPDRKWRRVFARCQLLISPMTRALVHGPPPSHGAFGALDAEQKMSAVGEKNVPSKYLSAEENANVFSALGTDCASMANGMAQLMIHKDSSWSILWKGVACYVRNYERKIVTIAIVDPGYERLRKPSIRCEIAIGVDVTFLALSNSFIAFEADSTKYALNFAVEEEAQSFLRIVSTLQTRRLRKKLGPAPTAPLKDDEHPTTMAVDPRKGRKKKKSNVKTSFVEWLLSDGQTRKEKKEKKVIKSKDISTPMNQKDMMYYDAVGSFLSKEGELHPTVNELYKHIHKDLDGDAADEMRNKKLLEAAVKHLGADEVRKIVEQKKVTPSVHKTAPPGTPKPGAVTLQAAVDTSRTSSTFSRGTRFSRASPTPKMALGETSKPIDMVSPEIPFIQPRKSKSISKEEFENVSQQEPIPPPPSLIECLRSEEEQKGIKVAENLALMDQKHRTSSEHELGSDNDYSQKDPTNKWKKLIEEAVKHLGVEEVRNIAEQTKSAVTLECVSTPTPRPCPRPRDLSRIQSTLPANI